MIKKLKSINWGKVFRITAWFVVIMGFIVTVGFTDRKQMDMLCNEVSINITYSHGQSFVEKSDVLQILHDHFGAPEGKPMHAINISLLESIINNNPFVSHAEVFSTIDGKLNIEVVPRSPIVRVINSFNESFYIDDQGVFMPLSEKYSAPVPVANGLIYDREAQHQVRTQETEEESDTSAGLLTVEKIYRVADYLRHHEFWNAQIEQVYVNQQGELELVPRVGNHTIVLGDEKEMDERFNKLFLFYREGLSKQGWDKYSTINLKFKDQVVCTKK